MSEHWKTRPISPVCEHYPNGMNAGPCGAATSFAYPASGGGWMALCWRHGQKHLPHASFTDKLIALGEKWEGAEVFEKLLAPEGGK